MASRHSYEWWRPDALLPALVIVGPYFLNKLIYIEFPGYLVFVATDYVCRIFSLGLLYLLLLRGMSPAMAVIVSTLIFGGIHWSYGAGTVVFATLAGLVLSTIFLSARNLIAPIIAHAAFDAFYFAGGTAFLWRIYNR